EHPEAGRTSGADLRAWIEPAPATCMRSGARRFEDVGGVSSGATKLPSVSTTTSRSRRFTISTLGLLIARQHVVHPLPRALEIEGAKLLRELDGLVDDALFLIVVAHLNVAREREVFAQWVALESVVSQDAAQIRVAGKQDAVHVVSLPFIPVGGREQIDDAWHGGGRVRLALDSQALVLARGEQVIDHVEALRALGIVDAAHIDKLLELAPAVITQLPQHIKDVLGWHDHRQLTKRPLLAQQLWSQQGLNALGEIV